MVTLETQRLRAPSLRPPMCEDSPQSPCPRSLILCPHGHWASPLPMPSDPTGPNLNPFSFTEQL